MEATAKKPAQKKINENWAAVAATGLRFRHGLGENFSSVQCPFCEFTNEDLHDLFAGIDDPAYKRNPCPIYGYMRVAISDIGRDAIELWKHARKGSQRDLLMGRIIERCPRLQAAILAHALAASTPAAKPAETRKSGRL